MKIVKAEIFDLDTTVGPQWHPIIVRLTTDEGITGLGEISLGFGTGHTAAAGMAKNIAENFIIGFDPFKTEKLWETLFRSTFWALGGGAVVFGGVSAFDIACWDIKGKALGVPVYQLLGGKTNDSLRAYASHVQGGWGPEPRVCITPGEFAAEAMKAVAEGYDAVKVSPVAIDTSGRSGANLRNILTHDQIKLFYQRVKAIRDAVGPNVDIILDLFSLMSETTAVQMGRLWEELNCYYLEEPVSCLNQKVQNAVASKIKIPMAAGERLYSRWGYRPYFEKQILSVVQPDLGTCGGITEGKKICDFANTYDIVVQCHTYGSPVATAASLQLEAAIPNFIIHEHATISLRPGNREICKHDYQPVIGRFQVPDLPGLGIELNDDFVNKSPRILVT
jgi:L-alanine-DL-glutamate epimerase-like enolase superfamily enzyme